MKFKMPNFFSKKEKQREIDSIEDLEPVREKSGIYDQEKDPSFPDRQDGTQTVAEDKRTGTTAPAQPAMPAAESGTEPAEEAPVAAANTTGETTVQHQLAEESMKNEAGTVVSDLLQSRDVEAVPEEPTPDINVDVHTGTVEEAHTAVPEQAEEPVSVASETQETVSVKAAEPKTGISEVQETAPVKAEKTEAVVLDPQETMPVQAEQPAVAETEIQECADTADNVPSERLSEDKAAALASLATEVWRLFDLTQSLAQTVRDSRMQRRTHNSLQRFVKHYPEYLAKLGVEIIDYTGAEYETGQPVSPLNLQDFTDDDTLIIEKILEPTVKYIGSADIIKTGVVVLGRKQ